MQVYRFWGEATNTREATLLLTRAQTTPSDMNTHFVCLLRIHKVSIMVLELKTNTHTITQSNNANSK